MCVLGVDSRQHELVNVDRDVDVSAPLVSLPSCTKPAPGEEPTMIKVF